MSAIEHPSEKILAALWSEDLPAADTESILLHLESCAACGERLKTIDPSVPQYRRFVEVVDPHLPAPPRAWADIWSEMESVDQPKRPILMQSVRRRQTRSIWMGPIAAVILLGVLTWPHLVPLGRAETLLIQAGKSAAQAHPQKRPRLRVVTRHASFVRPAVLANEATGDDQLRAELSAARYDWTDPLSATAFRGWRDQLRKRTDHVTESRDPQQFRIETTTPEGTLRDASIVFEGPDLTPVSLKLQFEDEGWVEIAAVPDAPVETLPTGTIPAAEKSPVAPEPTVTDRQVAERELQVRLAIDSLSGEAVAPVSVDVTPDGNVTVTPYHLSQDQERRLTASLSARKGVVVNPTERDSEPAGPVAAADAEPAIATAGTISSLAHLLADYASRFPRTREALLEPAGRSALDDLRKRRTAQLIREMDRLRDQLASTRKIANAVDAPATSGDPFNDLVNSASTLNRLVTAIFTTGADHIEVSDAWPELTRAWGRLRRLAADYERSLQTPPEEPR